MRNVLRERFRPVVVVLAFLASALIATALQTDAAGVTFVQGQQLGTNGVNCGVGEFDGQPGLDVLMVDLPGIGHVWKNNGGGTFVAGPSSTVSRTFEPDKIADLNGDGLDDYISVQNFGTGVKVWLNNAGVPGSFVAGQTVTFANGGDLADLDGDGDIDMGVAIGSAFRVFKNNGAGTFALDATYSYPSVPLTSSWGDVQFIDFTGDGDLDALVSSDFAFTIFEGNGDGTFATPELMHRDDRDVGDTPSAARFAAAADVDGDGDIDVLTGSGYSRVYKNDGSFGFTKTQQFAGSKWLGDWNLGDLDGDGDIDFFANNDSAPNPIFLNDGTGTYSQASQTITGRKFNVCLGDFDGDSDLDAALAGINTGNFIWLNTNTDGSSRRGRRRRR